MNKIHARQLLFFGMLIFLLAKLYLVLPATGSLAGPRLGGDAMTYLWKGKISTLNDSDTLPALRDIRRQRFLDDLPNERVAWARSNVAGRSLGTITPTFDLLAAGALAVAPDLRWAFAITEVVGVVAMAAGMGWFLFEVSGAAVAGLAMSLMAFAILPNQGIYAFIPSTLTLSCSLLLWAYLWRRSVDVSVWVVFASSLLILGLHPIAKIYIVLAPAVLWLRLGCFADWRNSSLWRVGITCAAAIGASLLLPVIQPPPSVIMGGLDFSNGFSQNFFGAISRLPDPVLRKNVLWALLLASALMVAPRASFTRPLALLLAGGVVMLAVSLVFFLPGFPADLFTRMWVPFHLFGAAAGARFALNMLEGGRLRRRLALVGIVGGLLLSSVFWVVSYVPHVMNWRNEVLVDGAIQDQLASFPAGSTLLYADTHVALQAALLLGGYRFGAIAYPMLEGTSSLEKLVEERHPAAIVTPGFTALNSLVELKAKNFIHRRQGLYMPAVNGFILRREAGLPLNGLRILVDNVSGKDAAFRWQPLDASGMPIGAVRDVPFSPGTAWVSLPISADVAAIRCFLPDTRAWILGFSAGVPTPHVLWPWKAGWSLAYDFRGKDDTRMVRIDFTPYALLRQVKAEGLISYVDSVDPVISDDGGLVFLRTGIATR